MEPWRYREFMNYLEKTQLPDEMKNDEKRDFERQAQRYCIRNNQLYYKNTNKNVVNNLLTVVQPPEAMEALKLCHQQTGHPGVDATIRRLRQTYYWPTMNDDVRAYVRGCPNCQLRRNEPLVEPLHPIPVHAPFHRIGIDLIGPLSITAKSQRYIIVATDYLTKWAITKAVVDKSATTVAQFLYKRICLTYGTPQIILSDQGLEFRNQTIRALCKLFDIKHTFATPYRPQTNGLTERLNKTLGEALARTVALTTDKTAWSQYLPAVTFAYNTNKQATTGFSPAQLLLGYQPKGPESLIQPPIDYPTSVSNELYIRGAQLHHHYESQLPLVKVRIEQKQAQQKEKYDKKRKGRPPLLVIGQQVYLRRDELQNRYDTKLETKWTGPYVILDHPNPATYLLQIGGTERLVHRDRLKIAHPNFTFTNALED